jgi:hypothetical protein
MTEARKGGSVLLAEDDDLILDFITADFEAPGYPVTAPRIGRP